MNGRNLNTPITNTQDIIDSRDIIERIDRLERDEDRDEDEDAELEALHALAEQGADYCGMAKHFIHDAYFVTYAQDFADDIGAINRDAAWPLSHIDWDAAADDLRQDYTALDFDGATYWAR